MERTVAERTRSESITVDNGSEFAGRSLDTWAYLNHVKFDFIRPGKPVQNGFIESFNGKLRDECLMNSKSFSPSRMPGKSLNAGAKTFGHFEKYIGAQ